MLENDNRRRVPETDHRFPPTNIPLERNPGESTCGKMTITRKNTNDSRIEYHRTSDSTSSFDDSRCVNFGKLRTEKSRDVESATMRKNKFFAKDETTMCESGSTNDETNNETTCDCERKKNNVVRNSTNFRDCGNLRERCIDGTNVCSTRCEFASGNDDSSWTRWSTWDSPSMGNRGWLVMVVVIVGLVNACSGDSYQCAVGLKTPGRTWPQGDIVLEYGQSLSILCMLNMTFTNAAFPGKNSSDLVFFRNMKEIEPEYIRIVNDTTIEMYVEKPPPAEDMYYCKLRLGDGYNAQDEAVCLNKVVIGFKPQEPQNFSCVSYNWEKMICSWDPVQNYVTTKFTLVFKLPGRAGGRKLYPCPKEDKELANPNTCQWDASTNPIYRQPYEFYTFIMNVANVLGNVSFPYKFHHYAHVIPAKPANLSVVNKTTDSALLHWSVPFPMQNFPSGLHHRVTFQHQWDHRKTWQVINITSDIHESRRYYNLTRLKFANTVYDVRIFMKSAVAIGEDKWSNFSDVTFRTPPRLPGLPPRTDIGSFEIADNNANRDVYLYWQAIPPYLENGDNFKYQIALVEEDGRKLYLLPNETTRTYAKFKGISFNKFRFEVVTTNVVGANNEPARIIVPSRSEMPPEPLAFTKIAFDGGLYELSWKPPLNSVNVTNYTIFWCDNERDRPYQCTGYLDWVHVSKNTTIYNMTTDPTKVYQFAISANTDVTSSGMVWASCTVIHNKVVGKMKSVWIGEIDAYYIQVRWNLDCSDRIGIVEGFNIYYCPIVSPYNLDCIKGSKLNTTIHADSHTIDGKVEGLKPYTTYSISVTVLTKSGEGSPSDPLYKTTLEAPPSTPPLDVRVTNVTNTTILVSWKPPTAMNGVLRYYEVHYNGKSQKIEETNHVLLKDLTSHRNYSISVTACTVSCSVRSSAILRMTDIGVPGKIGKNPNVRFINSSQVVVRWSPPNNPGGSIDYYQIWLADGEIKNSTKTEAYLPIPDCKTVGRERMYQFRVRAINVALDGTHLIGPWSEPGEGNCYSNGPSYRVWVIIWIISSLSGLAFVFCIAYTSKRMWLKCKAMQDVEVKLPPGLAPNMKLLQKVGDQHMRQSSTDSSGCSSGQESVTSSLTSNSHVSSDSGADVDPINQPMNKLLDPPPTWEASRLRQRNVGSTRPTTTTTTPTTTTTTNEATRWDSYVKVAKIGEPLTIDDGLSLARSAPNLTDGGTGYNTASPQAWSSTGYISMPSSEELSSNPSPRPDDPELSSSGYSVVAVVPKALRPTTTDVKTEIPKPTMPYVSLASLEQQQQQRPKDIAKPNDSLNFDDLSFSDSSSSVTFKPIDQHASTKPYVQTGLLDTKNKPLIVTEIDDNDVKTIYDDALTLDSRKPFASTFASSRTFRPKSSTDATITKPYVAVGSLPEIKMTKTKSIKDSTKRKISTTMDDKSDDKPYVTTGFHVIQQREKIRDACGPVDGDDDDSTLPPSYSMCWQNDGFIQLGANNANDNSDKIVGTTIRGPSYVTVGENPRYEQSQILGTGQNSSSDYVQHQRFEKSLPLRNSATTGTGTTTGTTDEQYSKVSVAPDAPQ